MSKSWNQKVYLYCNDSQNSQGLRILKHGANKKNKQQKPRVRSGGNSFLVVIGKQQQKSLILEGNRPNVQKKIQCNSGS